MPPVPRAKSDRNSASSASRRSRASGRVTLSDVAEAAGSGLALSSRNGYLSDEQRVQAMALSQALKTLADASLQGGNLADLEAQAMADLRAKGWEPDYLTVRQRSDLLTPAKAQAGQLVALGAARIGGTRLIDNLEF